MSSFLPSIMLVDVIEPSSLELWYSLVGTMEAQARGGDPTGRLVRETFIGRSVDHVLENYRLVITSAGPIYDSDEVTMDDEFLADAGSLLLPLSDNGRTVSKVIVFAALGRSSVGAAVPRRSELSRYPGRGLRCLRFPCRTPRSARGVIPQAVEALNLLHATSLTRGQGENCRHLLRLIKRAPPGF
jgi:hypothetical protein